MWSTSPLHTEVPAVPFSLQPSDDGPRDHCDNNKHSPHTHCTDVNSDVPTIEGMIYWQTFSIIYIQTSLGRFFSSSYLGIRQRVKLFIHMAKNCTNYQKACTCTSTHTRLTAIFPGLPGWASNRKVKTSGFY